ncbi:MAG: glycosyltransferase family 4 protein [Synergistales bacterium]
MASLVIDATSFTTPNRTGIANYAFHVSRELLRTREVEPRFFTFGNPADFPLPQDRLGRISPLESQVRWLIGRRLFPTGRRDWFWCPFYSWPLGLEKRARVILTVHDLLYRSSLGDRYQARFSSRERRFRRKFETAIRKANRIVAVSGTTADQVAETFGIPRGSIPVAYPGIDVSFFRPIATQAERQTCRRYGILNRFILALSSVSPRRNLETPVRTFASIAQDFPDVDFIIAGSRSYAPEYTERLETLAGEKAPGRIRFLDYIAREDLPALYSGAEMFVSASFLEGFDMPVVEAMACGTPTAVSDIPVHREVCGNVAAYFKPDDAEGLAEILRTRLSRQKISPIFDPGRFSWESSARIYADLIRS